jgi:pimeloyl-ACP methyl ester carboxylesterase
LIHHLITRCLLILAVATPWMAQSADTPNVIERRANVSSEGVRLAARVYRIDDDTRRGRPVILMSHGWGGTAALLDTQARAFAAAGYFVAAFDYRGWGDSDGRVILAGAAPEAPAAGGGEMRRFTAEVREIREVVDPLDQAEDLFNMIHWVIDEPGADGTRIGLWGTSFSGGLVVHAAARDPRVRALVSQVGWFGQPLAEMPPPALAASRGSGTKRARGDIGYPLPGVREVGNLRGAPIREKFLRYAPVEDAARAPGCAMLFIAAEREELFANREHPQRAFERAAGPKRYVEIPGIAHYGIYGEARDEATRLAIEWFDIHLKR